MPANVQHFAICNFECYRPAIVPVPMLQYRQVTSVVRQLSYPLFVDYSSVYSNYSCTRQSWQPSCHMFLVPYVSGATGILVSNGHSLCEPKHCVVLYMCICSTCYFDEASVWFIRIPCVKAHCTSVLTHMPAHDMQVSGSFAHGVVRVTTRMRM